MKDRWFGAHRNLSALQGLLLVSYQIALALLLACLNLLHLPYWSESPHLLRLLACQRIHHMTEYKPWHAWRRPRWEEEDYLDVSPKNVKQCFNNVITVKKNEMDKSQVKTTNKNLVTLYKIAADNLSLKQYS